MLRGALGDFWTLGFCPEDGGAPVGLDHESTNTWPFGAILGLLRRGKQAPSNPPNLLEAGRAPSPPQGKRIPVSNGRSPFFTSPPFSGKSGKDTAYVAGSLRKFQGRVLVYAIPLHYTSNSDGSTDHGSPSDKS